MPVACQSVFSDVSTNDSFSSDWLEILKFKALQIDTNRVEDLNRARSLDAPLAAGRPGFAEAASPGCKRPVQAGRLTHIGADDHRGELRRVPKARRHRIVAFSRPAPQRAEIASPRLVAALVIWTLPCNTTTRIAIQARALCISQSIIDGKPCHATLSDLKVGSIRRQRLRFR